MTRFQDGPAQGKTLMLKRAPAFLRVTTKLILNDTIVDALDQLTDEPTPDESLYAYQLTEKPGGAFIDGSKCRGFYPVANYQLVTEQPPDEILRNALSWRDWCMSHKHLVQHLMS